MRKYLIIALLSFVLSLSIQTTSFSYPEIIGKTVKISPPTEKEPIYLTRSKRAFNTLFGNIMGRAQENVLLLILAHYAVEIENTARVLVLDVDTLSKAAKVKVLNGIYKGKCGWILLSYVDNDY